MYPLRSFVVRAFVLAIALASATRDVAVARSAAAQPATAAAAPSGAPSAATTISGSVRDGSGRPPSGARVSLAGPTAAAATTGGDGGFAFAGVRAGSYLVTIVKTGFAPIDSDVTVADGATQALAIVLEPANQTTLRQIGRISTSRTGNAGQINRTPAAIGTITSQDYALRGQTQVTNMLEELPGVELQRFDSSAPGSNVVASVRGADPAETQVLYDGHPIVSGRFGTYLLNFLNTQLIGETEIDKGPGVLATEIDGLVNGSINFRTPAIDDSFKTYVYGGYDTFDGTASAIRVSDRIGGKFGFLFGYAQSGTPGFSTQPVLSVASSNAFTSPNTAPDATVTTSIPSSQTFDNHALLGKLDYRFSNATSLSASFTDLHSYEDYTSNLTTQEKFHIVASCAPGTADTQGCANNAGLDPTLTTYTNPAFAGLIGKTIYAASTADNLYLGNTLYDDQPIYTADLRTAIGPGTLLARYYEASIKREIDDPEEAVQPVACVTPACTPDPTTFSGAYYQHENDRLHGADFSYELPVGPNTYGVTYDTHADRDTYCTGGTPATTTCGVPSVIAGIQTIGVRGALHFGTLAALDVGDYESHGTYVKSRNDPRFGLVLTPNANVAVRLSAGGAYVAPAATDQENIIPNVRHGTLYFGPNIVPETSVSYDVGTDLRTSSHSKFVFDAYLTRLFDRFDTIASRSTSGANLGSLGGASYNAITTTFNSGTALQKGLEFAYFDAPKTGLGGTAYLNFLRAFAGGSNPNPPITVGTIYGNTADGQQFPGYPFTHARAAVNYAIADGAVKPEIGATYYGALNSFNQPAFTLFDANVRARLRGGVELIVSGENLFDHDDYRTYSAYQYGTSVPALGGGTYQSNLLFAPPRSIDFALQKTFDAGR